jgi:predicted dehydrogenase
MNDQTAPIRVAFLGADESTHDCLRAVLASRRFELVGLCEFDPQSLGAAELPPIERVRAIANWETLLEDGQIDAVVVARGENSDLRTEQLRKLIQVEKPLLVSHPVVDSMLIYYELDMIHRENNAPLVPRLALRQHPAIVALAQIVGQGADSPIGKVEHLSVERCVATPTRQAVERQFARDVDLIRGVAGDMTRLGSMAGAPGIPNYATLGVQMYGPQGIDARWSVVPVQNSGRAKIVLTGGRGQATVELGDDDAPWTLETTTGGTSERKEFPGWNAAAAELDALADAISGVSPQPDWVDACRSIELTETIERSLKKSRTIELYYEEYTEDATFKGTMTSIGCGLLVLTIFVLALAGVAEQMKIPYVGAWRYVLVAVFLVFLLLQLVMLTSGKKPSGKADDGSPQGKPPVR